MRASVGVSELATAAGTSVAVVRYHCRDVRGVLHGIAFQEGRSWRIPLDAARQFADSYRRYGSLAKKEPLSTPPADSGSPADVHPPREKKGHAQ